MRRLGSSGPMVSRLGLGLLTWGTQTPVDEARDQLTVFLEAGGTLVDTAFAYGGGASEETLGSLLRSGFARDDLVIATKAGLAYDDREVRRTDTSREYLLSCLDRSLNRLGVDHVDLWQVHVWSELTPVEETLSALDEAVRSGRVRSVGVSNWSSWRSAQAATHQTLTAGAPLVSTQLEYSLLNRSIESEALPAAQALGMGVLPWSPLCRGILTGKYRSGVPAGSRAAGSGVLADAVGNYRDEQSVAIVDAVISVAEEVDWSPLEVALAWVRDRPGVTAPIVGARTARQLEAALAVESCELPARFVARLDEQSTRRR
ncbi:aryl-alcohol dehydrogenase-like predicted oxidoreductase [Nocardioides sp. J9]|nr:aldo/keto reductase [Nocardioides sp. J9]TWG98548.1 aryl-alcohol dehydrogenase-like predicted oxidoreductase [Nocardioides sp. J9]